MDFELHSPTSRPASFSEKFERLLTNRAWVWPRWTERPPHGLGLGILFVVCAEFALTSHLLRMENLSWYVVRDTGIAALILAFIEGALALITTQAATVFEKQGSTRTLMTFFNLSLVPLLAYLPVTLVLVMSGANPTYRLIFLCVFVVQVLLRWQEAIELIYKLSKTQTMILLYILSAVTFVTLLIGSYIFLFGKLADLLS